MGASGGVATVTTLVGAEFPPVVLRATTRMSCTAAELRKRVVLVVLAGTSLRVVKAVPFQPTWMRNFSSFSELSAQAIVAKLPLRLTRTRSLGAAGASAVSEGVVAN